MKSIINFCRDHLSKQSIIALALMAIVISALIVLNAYVLDMTQGSYNIIDFLFM